MSTITKAEIAENYVSLDQLQQDLENMVHNYYAKWFLKEEEDHKETHFIYEKNTDSMCDDGNTDELRERP